MQERQEYYPIRGNSWIHVFGVFDHAHDLKIATVANAIESQMFSDGVLVRKKFVGEGVIDDCNVQG